MKRRNRVLTAVMTGMLGISTVLSGCGSSAGNAAKGSSDEKVSTATKEAGDTKASESDTAQTDNTLVIALQSNSFITDYEDNNLTKYYKEKLGIDIQFVLLPTDNSELLTKLSLMTASGEELPDILLTSALSNEVILQYGKDGFFLSVRDYLNDAEKMPNFNAIPQEDREEMLVSGTQADGNIYSFANSQENPWNLTPYRYYINRTWLDKLGMEVPQTLEELKEVLIAFRDQDPNGNGIQDEIPVYGMQGGSYGENILMALMNSFVFTNDPVFSLNAEGTQVVPVCTCEEWKQGLTWMNELYQEGLLAPGIFTDDSTQFKATLNAEENIVGLVCMGSYGNWTDTINNVNFKDMEMIVPFTGENGNCYTPYTPYTPAQTMYIFSDSDKIDLAVKFADECYDSYTGLVERYGIENEHWTKDAAQLEGLTNSYIEAGLYDEVTMALLNNIWSVNNNVTWRDVSPRYLSLEDICTLADITTGREYNSDNPYNLMAFNLKYYNDKHPEYVLPTLKYTAEETEQILDAKANIPSYVKQAMAEFITGARNVESGWSQYVSDLESMGLSTWQKAAQVAYERTSQYEEASK